MTLRRSDKLISLLSVLFWVTVAVAVGFCALKMSRATVIETNIMALLPLNEAAPAIRFADQKVAKYLGRNLVILIGHELPAVAAAAARDMAGDFCDKKLFSSVTADIAVDTMGQMLNLYQNNAPYFLTDAQREWMDGDDIGALTAHMQTEMYGLSSGLFQTDIGKDPFFLLPDYIGGIADRNIGAIKMVNDVPVVKGDGLSYAVLRVELADNPFSLGYQNAVLRTLDTAQSRMFEQDNNLTFIRSGLIFHAAHGVQTAQGEVSQMGTLSLLGVFLLLTLSFKSVRPVFVSLLSIAGACVFAFSVCVITFDKVHLLTLVFGTSLVGIAVDYALHFFAESYDRKPWDPHRALSRIYSGITLGVITSIIGFLGLCFAPFPTLQQMAVFSIAGLVFVYGCVVLFYPKLFRVMKHQPSAAINRFSHKYLVWWSNVPAFSVLPFLFIGVLVFGLIAPFLQGRDDIRAMQTLSPQLIENDMRASSLLGMPVAGQFFLVSGEDDNAMLKNMQNLSEKLEALMLEGELGGHSSLSQFMTSVDAQKQNIESVMNFMGRNESALKKLFADMPLPADVYDNYNAYLQSKSGGSVPLSDFLALNRAGGADLLYAGDFNGESFGIVTLKNIKNVDSLRSLGDDDPHTVFVDKVSSISDVLSHYRRAAAIIAVGTYLIIFLILCRRYGFLMGATILAPSVLASFIAIVVACLIGGSYSLFHVLALFLVMGIGVDYGIFLAESKKNIKLADVSPAMAAIVLSAITTLLSFGLLATSSTMALHDFGLTVIVGIGGTLILCPVVLVKHSKESARVNVEQI